MSQYLKVKVQFKDEEVFQEALIATCQDRRIQFEEHTRTGPARLRGYQGDLRDETAHYIVRKRYVGGSSNDLGFRREDGEIVAVISEFDTKHGGQDILNHVKREYARRKVKEMARRRGMDVEEIHDNGAIRLRLVPRQSRRPKRRVVRVRR